jgi:nucleoside 2-deoxyribosyltransferase
MEYAANAGLNWRLELRNKLQPLGVECIIPNEEEKDLTPSNFAELKLDPATRAEYINITRQLIARDLKFVERADFLVVYWDGEKMAGTIHECGYAYQLNKLIFLITPRDLSEVPGWFLSCCSYTFHDINEFIQWYKGRFHG